MNKKLVYSLAISGAIRFLLSVSKYAQSIENRPEISVPTNSWKRVLEGSYLYEHDVDPYIGDVYHENPLILIFTNFLIKHLNDFIPILFIIIDLITSVFIYYAAKNFTSKNFAKQQQEIESYAEKTEEIQMQSCDLIDIPLYCAIAYLFNPYSILNCVGKTTTILSNFLLSTTLITLSKDMKVPCLVALALETQKSFYPFILIVPVALSFSEKSKSKAIVRFMTVLVFAGILFGLHYISYIQMNSWKYLDSTYGFIVHCRDLQPNIGLFWYFFTEMFDHFRQLFLYTFQLNTTILYLFPLTFTFKNHPEFLMTILLALITIFRSYPCVGDVGFYMSLIPLWKRVSPFMSHNFVVVATFLVTSILAPTVYHLWIYANSANANFYFGVTLVFCTAQIFLLTDLTFGFLKREFCLKNGTTFDKDTKLSLE